MNKMFETAFNQSIDSIFPTKVSVWMIFFQYGDSDME